MKESHIKLIKSKLPEIQTFVSDELSKRGIHADIIKFALVDNIILLETEKFQTSPVMFKDLNVANFGGSIKVSDDGEKMHIWIPVSYDYEYFGSGHNSTDIFSVSVTIDIAFRAHKPEMNAS